MNDIVREMQTIHSYCSLATAELKLIDLYYMSNIRISICWITLYRAWAAVKLPGLSWDLHRSKPLAVYVTQTQDNGILLVDLYI